MSKSQNHLAMKGIFYNKFKQKFKLFQRKKRKLKKNFNKINKKNKKFNNKSSKNMSVARKLFLKELEKLKNMPKSTSKYSNKKNYNKKGYNKNIQKFIS